MVTLIGQVSSLGYVQPIWSLVGLAGVNVHHVLAVFALYGAAPLEFALALGDTLDTHSVIAPPTAHDLTAVCASGGLVAHSACCPQGACKEMFLSVIFMIFFVFLKNVCKNFYKRQTITFFLSYLFILIYFK